MHFIIDLNDELKYDTPDNVYINGDLAAQTAADETYYTAENLEPDTEYMVKVTAVTADDENTVINTPIRTDKKGNVHNVLDEPYNAKGDGETLDTDAIQSAIDSCETNDIVLIPEGYTFLTGALDLKSNMTLEVNGTLLSSKNAEDFEKRDQTVDTDTLKGGVTAGGAVYNAEAQKRLIWSRSEGWEQYCYRSLINIGYLDENTDYSGEKSYVCENVKICGTGTITGDSYRGNYAPINGNATATTNNEKWTITINNGTCTIANNGHDGWSIQYNKQSPRFTCYSSKQEAVTLYKSTTTTSLANVTVTDGDTKVDVYTVTGIKVRSQVSRDNALEGLDKGVYIIRNKKYLVE